ncbi:helicase associated domain-containing protein [Streptomyces avidinii]|uniref:helicase associated domain-containing protein n=1 Tax=Streptomyces avidinii TaxID=1895 RepID=UPI00378970C0
MWAITTALASHGHRIVERLPDKANRLPKETSTLVAKRWHFDFTLHPERIARAMDLIAFNLRGPLSRSRRAGLAAAQAFHDDYGHLDVPADHTDPICFELGRFIGSVKVSFTVPGSRRLWGVFEVVSERGRRLEALSGGGSDRGSEWFGCVRGFGAAVGRA